MEIALLYVSNTPLIVKVCNIFSIGVIDCARLKVYLLSLIVQRCNCFSVDDIEC